MTNQSIRQAAIDRNVKLWEIADALGINDGNFSRRLRHEFSDDERERILSIIDEIAKERD